MDELDGLARFPLPRRGMVISGLVTGVTLATTQAQAQAIHTDSVGLAAGDVQIPTDDGNIPGYFARPAGAGPFPIVLVVEEIFGVNDYLKDVCRRLAKAGYLAVAPEIYARLGDISKMTDMSAVLHDVIDKAPDDRINRDLDAAAAWAGKNAGDPSRLGITGFCRGGRAVWLYDAHNPALKAAVSWYGYIVTPDTPIQPKSATDVIGDLHAPLLGLYGDMDSGNKVTDLDAAQAKARAAGKTVQIQVYPGAGHAFHADYRPSYRKEAAEDGWQRMLAWFKRYGV